MGDVPADLLGRDPAVFSRVLPDGSEQICIATTAGESVGFTNPPRVVPLALYGPEAWALPPGHPALGGP